VIKRPRLALTKSIAPHSYVAGPNDTVVNLTPCRDETVLMSHRPQIDRAREEFDRLFNLAIFYIGQLSSTTTRWSASNAPNMTSKGRQIAGE
jgi:hypothetical protein